MNYLRTEWGVRLADGRTVQTDTELRAREIANESDTAVVVHRSISDWGTDE